MTGWTTGRRAFDKARWAAARMRVTRAPDLTMHGVPQFVGRSRPAAPWMALEWRHPRSDQP
jgi:hypothetical protein